MTANHDQMLARKTEAYAKRSPNGFLSEEDLDALYSLKYTTEMLEADVEHGDLGILTHPSQAAELLKLDTVELRKRAMGEAQTLTNIMGGVLSGALYNAVNSIKHNIANGTPDAELYGERFAREAREKEAELRRATGDSSAIYYPRGLRQA